jgi:RNA recognition motif-containing protein
LDDEGLFNLFKDLKVTKAHVVKNRNQRSKGFGFVEFDNEADQKAALTAAEKMVVSQRELIVKVALTAPETKEGGSNAAPSAPAPAAAKDSTPAAPKSDDKSSS